MDAAVRSERRVFLEQDFLERGYGQFRVEPVPLTPCVHRFEQPEGA
jgi:hypothetical protein